MPNGLDKRRENLKVTINKIIQDANVLPDIINGCKNQKIDVRKGRGILFIDAQGYRLKGSEFGWSLAKMEKHLTKKMAKNINQNLDKGRNLNLSI